LDFRNFTCGTSPLARTWRCLASRSTSSTSRSTSSCSRTPVPRNTSMMTRSRLANAPERPRSSLSSRRFSASVRKTGGVRGSLRKVTDLAGFSETSPVSSAQAKNDLIAALNRCRDAGERGAPEAVCATADAVNASSSIPGVTWLMVTPGCRVRSTPVKRFRSRQKHPGEAFQVPQVCADCVRRATIGCEPPAEGFHRLLERLSPGQESKRTGCRVRHSSYLPSSRSGPWEFLWAGAVFQCGRYLWPR